jgi:hypothetical protein
VKKKEYERLLALLNKEQKNLYGLPGNMIITLPRNLVVMETIEMSAN